MYSLNLLAIAMELASEDPCYEDVASKFWEHFLYIAVAINTLGSDGGMWNEEDGFFYDMLHLPTGAHVPMKIRSMVGLIPLFAVESLEQAVVDKLAGFKRRMEWFLENRKDLSGHVPCMDVPGEGRRRLLSIVDGEQLRRVLQHSAGRERVSLALRDSLALAVPQGAPVRDAGGRHGVSGGLRAGGIGNGHIRRQFELAGADLVPGQLPDGRIAAEVPSLSGR